MPDIRQKIITINAQAFFNFCSKRPGEEKERFKLYLENYSLRRYVIKQEDEREDCALFYQFCKEIESVWRDKEKQSFKRTDKILYDKLVIVDFGKIFQPLDKENAGAWKIENQKILLNDSKDLVKNGFDMYFEGFENPVHMVAFDKSGSMSRNSRISFIDEDFYEELEEILIMGDIGVNATEAIIENLKEKVKENKIKDPAECKELLINSIKEQMDVGETAYRFENEKSVVLVIGVNGVGKTTSVGKLAGKLKDQGKKVVLAAADTFRAAAGTQLQEWANRAGVEMIGGQEGADPGAIVYDAVAAAKARNADVLLCDTAGRLHNKKNLMEELRKINRILEKEYPDAFRETLVVLDATTGQNALAQAREFADVADITGIILTKMDGTAKGGIAVAIHSELGIPVKYIGVGETIEDLQKFDSNQFVNALFDVQEGKSSPRP